MNLGALELRAMCLHLTRPGTALPRHPDMPGKAVPSSLARAAMQTRYFAYYVDLRGATHASYELHAADDARALSAAQPFLKFHPSLEIWYGARRIARLQREERASHRRH